MQAEMSVKRRRTEDPTEDVRSPDMRGSSVQARSTLKDVWLRQMSTVALNHLPRPVVEVARRATVLRLRRLFAVRVRALGGSVDVPRESFNRWILYRMTREGGDAFVQFCGQTHER